MDVKDHNICNNEQLLRFLDSKTLAVKNRFLEMFIKLGFGHTTSAFSCADVVVALWYNTMIYKTDDPEWAGRDRFVMSKGHAAGILFPIFEDLGFMTKDEMENTIKIGGDFTKLQKLFLPGYEFYGGSLGIGLGLSAGLAYGAKMNREDWLTFTILGDAECYEGSIWEAAMFAGHNKLNNLITIIDRNYLGITDFTENMLVLEPLEDKWKACNWDVIRIDGHNIQEIINALAGIRSRKRSKPLCIIADTIKGNGIDFMSNKNLMHGVVPKGDKIEQAFYELNNLL
jgi:transketolase